MTKSTAFKKRFDQLHNGMTTEQVAAVVGQPDDFEDTVVPIDSGWGTQDALAYPIRGGESVLQWTYLGSAHDHCVWFAKLTDGWRLTMRASLPFGTASDRER